MKRITRTGFTLLELLISITILTIIVGMVYASFSSVTRAAEVAREVAERTRMRQFLGQSLASTVPSAHADAAVVVQGYRLLGEDEAGPLGPADRLTFCTATPLLGSYSLPGVLKQVCYQVVDENAETEGGLTGVQTEGPRWSDAPSLTLEYTETPLTIDMNMEENDLLPDFEMEEGAYAHWRVPIGSFDVKFFDGEEWLDSWDSVELGLMPWAIHIGINFAKTEEELAADQSMGINPLESPDFDMTYVLPAGAGTVEPFLDLNPAAAALGEQDLFQERK